LPSRSNAGMTTDAIKKGQAVVQTTERDEISTQTGMDQAAAPPKAKSTGLGTFLERSEPAWACMHAWHQHRAHACIPYMPPGQCVHTLQFSFDMCSCACPSAGF
jgi:hypothetical protein